MCPELKVIHGSVSIQEPVKVGDNVKVMCKAGYMLYPEFHDAITCTETGEYSTSIPECIGKENNYVLRKTTTNILPPKI